MPLCNTSQQWGWLAKTFHWIIFLLILSAWVAVESHEGHPKGSAERAQWMLLHKSLGVCVLFLVWLRLGWRLSNTGPAPEKASRWQLLGANAVHWLLYGLMIVMPLSGFLASQFSGRILSFFGAFDIPVFLAENKPLATQLMDLHKDILWPLLLLFVAAHVAAALWHHFVSRDRTLKRMLPFGK